MPRSRERVPRPREPRRRSLSRGVTCSPSVVREHLLKHLLDDSGRLEDEDRALEAALLLREISEPADHFLAKIPPVQLTEKAPIRRRRATPGATVRTESLGGHQQPFMVALDLRFLVPPRKLSDVVRVQHVICPQAGRHIESSPPKGDVFANDRGRSMPPIFDVHRRGSCDQAASYRVLRTRTD